VADFVVMELPELSRFSTTQSVMLVLALLVLVRGPVLLAPSSSLTTMVFETADFETTGFVGRSLVGKPWPIQKASD
jgi:hypothetical protein